MEKQIKKWIKRVDGVRQRYHFGSFKYLSKNRPVEKVWMKLDTDYEIRDNGWAIESKDALSKSQIDAFQLTPVTDVTNPDGTINMDKFLQKHDIDRERLEQAGLSDRDILGELKDVSQEARVAKELKEISKDYNPELVPGHFVMLKKESGASDKDVADVMKQAKTYQEALGVLSKQKQKTLSDYGATPMERMNLEDELIKRAKNFKGEKTSEFERFERGLYSSQKTGDFRYEELLQLKKELEEIQKGHDSLPSFGNVPISKRKPIRTVELKEGVFAGAKLREGTYGIDASGKIYKEVVEPQKKKGTVDDYELVHRWHIVPEGSYERGRAKKVLEQNEKKNMD